jgi:hypothetical protein
VNDGLGLNLPKQVEHALPVTNVQFMMLEAFTFPLEAILVSARVSL